MILSDLSVKIAICKAVLPFLLIGTYPTTTGATIAITITIQIPVAVTGRPDIPLTDDGSGGNNVIHQSNSPP